MAASLLLELEGVAKELDAELEARFGFSGFTARASLVGPRRVAIRGSVLSLRYARELTLRLRQRFPGLTLENEQQLLATGRFRALLMGAPVWRTRHASASGEVSTWLLPEDGAVEVLHELSEVALVRAMDATVGWVDSNALGRECAPPVIGDAALAPRATLDAARRFLGVQYELGGTTERAVDCSGLVQRSYLRGSGLRLPRHSTDQLAFGAGGAPMLAALPRAGDLVFSWTERDGPCHVGIASGTGAVVHASQSRKRAIEEPLSAFLTGATRVRVASSDALLAAHRRFLGKPQLALLLGDERGPV